MTDPEECLHLLIKFIKGGDASQAVTAAGAILAFVAKLEGTAAQVEARYELRR